MQRKQMLFRIAPAEKLGNEILMRYDCLVLMAA
jgi:hypothetical protein